MKISKGSSKIIAKSIVKQLCAGRVPPILLSETSYNRKLIVRVIQKNAIQYTIRLLQHSKASWLEIFM